MNGFFGTSPWTNVFWIRNGGQITPTPTELNWLCQQVLAHYQATLLGVMHTSSQTTDASGLYYGPGDSVTGGDFAATAFGLHAATALPAQVAVALGWRVNQRYRGGHPRTYLGGMSSQAIANPRGFDPAWLATVVTNGNTFHSNINSTAAGALTDLHLGTVSFVLRNQWRTPPVFRDFQPGACHADQRIDTQRRRLGADPPP